MVAIREPVLKPVAITDLHPTQITVGMREVNAKRKGWREKRRKKSGEFLGKHVIPVILGPNNRHYVIDHHHLARALHEEGVKDVLVTIVANLGSGLIDYSQKMTSAAIQIADMNVWAHRS
jgi:hypothetical protein